MRYACICMYTHDNIPKMNQTYQTSVKIECQSNNANKSEKTVECLSILSVNFIKDFFREKKANFSIPYCTLEKFVVPLQLRMRKEAF